MNRPQIENGKEPTMAEWNDYVDVLAIHSERSARVYRAIHTAGQALIDSITSLNYFAGRGGGKTEFGRCFKAFTEALSFYNDGDLTDWKPIARAPKNGILILVRGDSGYARHQKYYSEAYYDAEFRPHAPWLNSANESLDPQPTEFMFLPGGK